MSTAGQLSKPPELSPEQVRLVRDHLRELAASPAFAGSKRSQDFIQLIVEHALAGRWDNLRERMIGAEMFGRPIDYDTANDAVVRVKATEVRKKLSQYYLEREGAPSVRIELASGSYVPRFQWKTPDQGKASPLDSAYLDSAYSIATGPAPVSTNYSGTESTSGFVGDFIFSRRAKAAGILAGSGLLLVAALVGFKIWPRGNKTPAGIHAVAILPLENLSGDPNQEYFADGMTEELIADLGQVSALSVVSRTSVMTYKGTKKTLPEIARELGVDAIVEGSVVREGNRVRITAQLIDARTDHHIWAQSYIRDLSSVLSLQGEVARSVVDEIRVNVTPQEEARLARVRRVDAAAQDQYLQAMKLISVSDPKGALVYLQRAVQIDPNYAQAHAALANTYGWMGSAGWIPYSTAFPLEKAEAAKAIQQDEALPDGHVALANAAMNLNWDWSTQESELKRALELNPNSASVRWAYSDHLERQGRFPDAISELKMALQLDPISSRAYTQSAFTYYFARQYDQALAQLRRADTLPHKSDELLYPLGVIYSEKGLYKQAVEEFQQQGDATHVLGHLGNAYARMGSSAKARELIVKLRDRVEQTNVGRYEIALIYAGLGEKDEAFSFLEQALAASDKGLTYLKIDPCVDPLRSDARFQSLEHRVGLLPD